MFKSTRRAKTPRSRRSAYEIPEEAAAQANEARPAAPPDEGTGETRQRLPGAAMTAGLSYAAIGLLFIGAAAGSGDYALILDNQPPICAKSEANCETAREAIRTQRWPIARPNAATSRIPMPGCFSAESLVIRGYNDR